MIKLFIAFIIALLPTLSLAQSIPFPGPGSGNTAFTPAAAIALTDNDAQEAAQTVFTFTSKAAGAAASNRYLLAAISGRSGSTATDITSVTIGGIAATNVIRVFGAGSGSGENVTAIYIAAVPTGTTATVVVTFNVNFARCSVSLYRAVDLVSSTATATASSLVANPTGTFNVSAGGFAIGAAYTQATSSFTWTNLTENVDTTTNFTNTYTAASSNFATAQTSLAITATPASSVAPTGVFAAFR